MYVTMYVVTAVCRRAPRYKLLIFFKKKICPLGIHSIKRTAYVSSMYATLIYINDTSATRCKCSVLLLSYAVLITVMSMNVYSTPFNK